MQSDTIETFNDNRKMSRQTVEIKAVTQEFLQLTQ